MKASLFSSEVFVPKIFYLRGETELLEYVGASIVPFPWKVAKTRSSGGLGLLIIAPDGSSYCQWASCRENLEKSGSMTVDMMDTIEEFLATGIPGVKVNLGKGKMLAKTESSVSTKATVDRDWVVDPRLPDGWKVCIGCFDLQL